MVGNSVRSECRIPNPMDVGSNPTRPVYNKNINNRRSGPSPGFFLDLRRPVPIFVFETGQKAHAIWDSSNNMEDI